MARAEVAELVGRIAAALRDRSGETPRTFEFRMRDDKSLRAIDQVVTGGKRVLLLEAYRGVSAVYMPIAAVRRDGPADAPWFVDMTAHDEGVAIGALERAIETQLEGGDFAHRGADVEVDVRPAITPQGEPFSPRYDRRQHAAALAGGPLLVAVIAVLAAWLVYGLAFSLAGDSTGTVVAIVGMTVAQVVASIAVGAAVVAGRAGRVGLVATVALLAAVLTPLASVAMPVGPVLGLVGGMLTVVACVLAAGAPRSGWLSLAVFAACGAAGVGAASALASVSVAAAVVAVGMIVATIAAGVLLGRGMRAAGA